MSHNRIKTTYNEDGPFGSVEKKTLYCHQNLSCDYTTFYDEHGAFILSFPDTMDNNIFEAMKKLAGGIYNDFRESNDLADGIEYMSLDEQKKCGL